MSADAHVHLFRDGFFGAPGSRVGVDEYERLRVLGNIDEALVLGYEGDERYAGNNAYIRELATTRPWMKLLYYLDASIVPEEEELLLRREQGYLGFSLYLDEGQASLSRWPASTLRSFGREGSIVSINASPDSLVRATPQIADMTSCAVLISHLGLPGLMPDATREEARQRMRPLLELQSLPQVSVKLSGLYAIDPLYSYRGAAPHIEEVFEAFGPARLLWGSDFSPAMGYGSPQQVASLPPWLASRFSTDELAAVAGQNLRQTLQNAGGGSASATGEASNRNMHVTEQSGDSEH